MKDEWKAFLETLPFEKEFLHRDEFQKEHPEFKNIRLPAIYISQRNVLDILVSAEEINMQKDIAGLKKRIEMNLQRTLSYPFSSELK